MPLAIPRTFRIADAEQAMCGKLAAGIGALLINAALDGFADSADQSNATWRDMIGATHAADARAFFIRQRIGHTTALRLQLTTMKADTQRGATSTTADARVKIDAHSCGSSELKLRR